jgi:hypothetical protein
MKFLLCIAGFLLSYLISGVSSFLLFPFGHPFNWAENYS